MIVASIRKGFQQHSLKGLGCADCGGGCGKFTGGPIGPAASHIHALMGLGDSFPPEWTSSNTSNTGTVFCADGSIQVIGNCVQAMPVAIPGITAALDPSIVAPVATPVAQTAQQITQSTGVVSTPVVAATPVAVSTDNPLMDFLESTIFGIPLWLIGIGGLALGFMGSEK